MRRSKPGASPLRLMFLLATVADGYYKSAGALIRLKYEYRKREGTTSASSSAHSICLRDVLDRKELPVRDAAGGPGSDDHVTVGEKDGIVRVLVLFRSEKHRDVHHREHLLCVFEGRRCRGGEGEGQCGEGGGRETARERARAGHSDTRWRRVGR